jgi:hypothetical protein
MTLNQITSIDFYKKYILKFNISSLPVNFHKYKLINLEEINLENLLLLNGIRYLNFPYSTFVVIESIEEQIYLYLGGNEYLIKKNRIFLPVLISAHRVDIGLTKDIKIYAISIYETDLNYDLESKHLFGILTSFSFIYFDTKVLAISNNNYNYLVFGCGLYGHINKVPDKQIDENIVYYDIEKELIKKNIDHNTIYSEIFFIDKYVQSDIFKFYENNNILY